MVILIILPISAVVTSVILLNQGCSLLVNIGILMVMQVLGFIIVPAIVMLDWAVLTLQPFGAPLLALLMLVVLCLMWKGLALSMRTAL